MNQSNLLKQAQQGEPSAIAALMNAALEPKGVTARVDLEGDCLYVMFESVHSLNPDTLMRFTYRGLQELDTTFVKRVKLYEQKIGENTISWKREFATGVPLEIPVALTERQLAVEAVAADGQPALALQDVIDQVNLGQADLGLADPDAIEDSSEDESLEDLASSDSHFPIKTFWQKRPVPFALMVCFAFLAGGIVALLLSTGQRQNQSGPNQEKQQEAESYLRDMNEAQRAFYSQNTRFAGSLEELERSANVFFKAYYYSYKLEANGQTSAKITAVPRESGLKSYVGAVFANASQVTSVICQTQQPADQAPSLPQVINNQPQCPEGTAVLPEG
jgi:Type IV pilin-like G and H, putative